MQRQIVYLPAPNSKCHISFALITGNFCPPKSLYLERDLPVFLYTTILVLYSRCSNSLSNRAGADLFVSNYGTSCGFLLCQWKEVVVGVGGGGRADKAWLFRPPIISWLGYAYSGIQPWLSKCLPFIPVWVKASIEDLCMHIDHISPIDPGRRFGM